MDQTTGPSSSIVEMRNITKDFPGVRALADVSFRLQSSGELRGLVGKNGAGKSTLMNVLTGVFPPDSGEIRIQERSFIRLTTTISRQLGIACVHQHSQLVPSLSIAENVFCGSLPTTRLGLVDWSTVYSKTAQRLGSMGLDIDVRRKVEGLSVAERQIIEIAKALFADARIIILDEATAPLPKNEVEMLFGFVRRQREHGAAFVYISHYLEEIFELCETVTVMKDGRNIGDYAVGDLSPAELIRQISGAEVERFRHAARTQAGGVLLDVRNLDRPGFYTGLSLTLQRGEIVGLDRPGGLRQGLFRPGPVRHGAAGNRGGDAARSGPTGLGTRGKPSTREWRTCPGTVTGTGSSGCGRSGRT